MFYKIHACNQLVAKSGKQYDLVIRARPDVVFNLEYELDWLEIADMCNTQKIIWADHAGEGFDGFSDIGGGGYGTGDSFAISSQAGIDFYANVGMSIDAFKEQGLAYFSVVSPHAILGHGLWLGGYRRQSIPITQKLRFMNISLKAEDIYKAIHGDLINMDKDLADDFINALKLDMAGVPYKDTFQLEKYDGAGESQLIRFCSPPTSGMITKQLLSQFDQDTVIASYDLMLYSSYYNFGSELIGRYFEEIICGSPIAPLVVNKSLSLNFITSDGFVDALLKIKDTPQFGKLSAFFSTFILEAVAEVRVKSKNLDLLAEIFG